MFVKFDYGCKNRIFELIARDCFTFLKISSKVGFQGFDASFL
jgi:hypothetical protein